MRNILRIAQREFIATVLTRGFIIGLFIVPALIAMLALVGPRLFNFRNFKVQGDILVIDRSGRIIPELQKAFDPLRIAARRNEEARRTLAKVPQQVRQIAGSQEAAKAAVIEEPIPEIHILTKPADSNIEQEKDWLNTQPKGKPHLALIVIHPDAVVPFGNRLEFGSYDLFVPPSLDDRAGSEIQRGLREAIVSARFQARSLDQATIDAITQIPPVQSVTVARNDQRKTVQGFKVLLPAAFGGLLLMAVVGAGGQLLTTTVEEKSSRVVEVLLSAVTPMELMAGKLLGQMAVSMIGMGLYIAMGIMMLASFALFGLFDFSLILYLLIFFVITYLVMGSLMMAVGAAVNDMKEAQGLMAPLTIAFMIPWILWLPISRAPDSVLSIAMSFIPPVNTFAMLLRMASNTPPPLWQAWLSILIGVGSAFCALWFAAKVFRIGLLMYGKPPNFATLIRWVRAA
jgi:ABC-2 type transport system permease protein